MDTRRGNVILCLLCAFIFSGGASKCPEPRKPHVTSCTIFYNCINLPEGGYVWAPAKCPDGLVFQPYLRICVLPGDTWTCDTLATESPLMAEHYVNPGSIDPGRTSYLGYTQDSSPYASHPAIGSPKPVDGISELDNIRHIATPYPLIETVDTSEKNLNDDNRKVAENFAVPQAIERRVENYLYQFFNSQQKIPSRVGPASDNAEQHVHSTWLKGFINRMLLYENIAGSSKQRQVYHGNPVIAQFASTTCEPAEDLRKNEHASGLNNDVLSYIVQSYILGRRQSDGKMKKKTRKSSTTAVPATEMSDEEPDADPENSGERPIDLVINGPKAENNIVAIRGNLGAKEYITVDRYKTLSPAVRLDVIEILPCARGIRLPNGTDCTKYYTCDPDTAAVVQFSCSPKTAFNDVNRVCEAQRYKTCARELGELSVPQVSRTEDSMKSWSSTSRTETKERENPCQTTGKFVDPESDRNYYVCYSSNGESGGIDSIIMSCPNDLIFCQERRLCTTRKRCYD